MRMGHKDISDGSWKLGWGRRGQQREAHEQRPKGRRDRAPCATDGWVRGEDEQARRATLGSDCERL